MTGSGKADSGSRKRGSHLSFFLHRALTQIYFGCFSWISRRFDRIVNAQCPSRRVNMPDCEIDRFGKPQRGFSEPAIGVRCFRNLSQGRLNAAAPVDAFSSIGEPG